MRIDATFALSTPCFHEDAGGGLDATVVGGHVRESRVPRSASALRPPAFKGMWEFWWRAAEWPQWLAGAGAGLDAQRIAMGNLRKRQSALFGAPAHAGVGGQGCFAWTMAVKNLQPWMPADLMQGGWSAGQPSLAYLAGPGLVRGGQWTRGALFGAKPCSPCLVSITCRFRRGVPVQDVWSVARGLWLLGMAGGIGARSRRGWGSLSLQQLSLDGEPIEGLAVPADLHNWRDAMRQVLGTVVGASASAVVEAPITAFGESARVDISASTSDGGPDAALKLMKLCGLQMATHRSVGKMLRRNGHDLGRFVFGDEGIPSELTFMDDHDAAANALNADEAQPQATLRRLAFGAPLPFFFSTSGRTVVAQPMLVNNNNNEEPELLRHASPLFVHIHRFADGGAALVQSMLPARYLPPDVNAKINFTGRGVRNEQAIAAPTVAEIGAELTNYLNRFGPESGPEAVRVWPPST